MWKSLLLIVIIAFQIVSSDKKDDDDDEKEETCGVPGTTRYVYRKNPNSRHGSIVNGIEAKQLKWPWMVAILKKNRSSAHCSGFLIDRRHVITAAHCFVSSRSPKDYAAVLGNIQLAEGIKYNISRIVVHKGYNSSFFYDDIAIVRLDKLARFAGFKPICLPDKKIATQNLTGLYAVAAGWGATSSVQGSPPSDILMQLDEVPIISNNKCAKEKRNVGLFYFIIQFPFGINSGLLCTGVASPGKNVCKGDSGGPLMLNDRGRWYAVGVFSFMIRCGETGAPSGYTRISEYLTWIYKHAERD